MSRQSLLLRAAILSAIAAPLAPGCGGKTADGGAGASSPGGDSGASGTTSGSNGAAGSNAGTSGASGTAGTGGTSTTRITCFNPVPLLVGGKPTGVETCDDGSLHIKTSQACPSLLPRGSACGMTAPGSACNFDKDCTEMPNGYCAEYQALGGDGNGACGCSYGCVTNDDCPQESVCLCGDPVGKCVPTTCISDDSCDGGQCQSYDSSMGCDFTSFACHTASDTCASPKDCAVTEGAPYCVPSQVTGVWACESGGCAIGRPFFVEAALRTSGVVQSSAWM